jgi:predicted O-linked N-acetylglucosamine transferase (SPINDLY family)
MRPGKIDPSRIAFSTAITLNSHNRNNWALKKKIGSLYAYLFQHHKVIEEYFSSYAMLPLPYRQSMVHIKNKVPNGRLRVGFVSRFLFNPAVGLFMDELIPHFDPFKYETFAFAIGSSKSMKVVEKLNQIAETVSIQKHSLDHTY